MAEKEKKEYSKDVAYYDLKQAEKVDGKWKKAGAVVQYKGIKISEEKAEQYNENYRASGSYYELNKAKDEKFQELVKAKMKPKSKAKKTKED